MTGALRPLAVVAAVAFNLALNGLAGAGLLFGVQTGEVSDSVPTGVTPAGWAFSIWGVIFLGTAVFAAWALWHRARAPRYDALVLPFVLANVLNGLWQVPWSLRLFGVAAVVIVGILASLAWLYVRLDRLEMTGAERWALGVPVSLWLAWLCVATALNVTIALSASGVGGGAVWPPLVVLAVAGIGAALLSRTGDVAFAGVIVWAFAAIYAATPALATPLAVGVVLVTGAVAFGLWRGASPLPVTR